MLKSNRNIQKLLCVCNLEGVNLGPFLKTTVNFLRCMPISMPTKRNQNILHKMKGVQMFYERGFRDEGYYSLFIFSIFRTFTRSISGQIGCFWQINQNTESMIQYGQQFLRFFHKLFFNLSEMPIYFSFRQMYYRFITLTITQLFRVIICIPLIRLFCFIRIFNFSWIWGFWCWGILNCYFIHYSTIHILIQFSLLLPFKLIFLFHWK